MNHNDDTINALGLIITFLGKINSDQCLNKAYNQVILREVAKITKGNINELMTEVDNLHAQYVFDSEKVFSSIVKSIENPDELESRWENLF
ncbi:hypothetical protein [Runella sp.]|uniref:hypothetical protein n=1 Tax=Runella sp. TaxID=1960881 RepID=UPI003D09B039